ncbi:MAG TPA: glycosyltransferase [Pseudoxanthomonas sp.]|nr:glycosyltransferase [Pseudoxanthomonas sp.]
MARSIEVSAIIPTYNRRELVIRAIETVLAQTRAVEEIIVVDDGSTDGTGHALQARFGDRIRYVWQANAGVSAARNHGMRLAQGRYFALLDSDDEWLPDKTQAQIEWLQARPDFGMVVCDVQRVDRDGAPIDVFHRREVIREDGRVLRYLIHNPALAPASAILRREVFEDVGGFDESLRTAEDIDFHLRIAQRWPIGVVELPLVRAMRGHDGLSAESSTYDDYVRVVEAAVQRARGEVEARELDQALASTYARNARGMIIRGRWGDGWKLARKAWGLAQEGDTRRELLRLAPFAARRAIRQLLPG